MLLHGLWAITKANIHLVKAQAVSLTKEFFSAQGLLENIE